MNSQYILDTNILVHFVRWDTLWQRLVAQYALFLIEPKPVLALVPLAKSAR